MNEETYPTEENVPGQDEHLPEEMNEAPAHEPLPAPPAATRRSPWPWVGLAALALLVVAVILVFVLDLPGRLTGRLDAAAAAMPADTTVYAGVNLLQLTPAKLDRIVKPFMAEVTEAEFRDTSQMLDELDKSLDESYGFTFTDDIQPWVGQYLGVGLAGDLVGDFGFDPENASVILAIEVRDKKAADAFLGKLRASLVEKSDKQVDEQEYEGVKIYISDVDDLVFARSKGLVLFTPRLEDIQAAIDAQREDSLGDNADFKALGRQLPSERFLTIFADGEQYMKMFSDQLSMGMLGAGGLGQLSTQMQAVGSFAASLAIVDEGLQLDLINSYETDKLSETQRSMMENSRQAARIAEVMPDDAMLLVAGQGLNNVLQMYKEVLGDQMGGDYDESMRMLEGEIGFNLDSDLFAYLEGEYGLAVFSEPNTIFAQMGVPLGMVFISRISDHDQLESTIQKFNDFASQGGAMVRESDVGEDHIYTLGNPFMGDLVSFGISQDYLAIGLTSKTIESVFSPVEPLAKNPEYQEVWTHFSKDSVPVFYLKLDEFLEALRGSMVGSELESYDETIASLKPVSYIAMGTIPLKGDQVRMTVIVFVEKAE